MQNLSNWEGGSNNRKRAKFKLISENASNICSNHSIFHLSCCMLIQLQNKEGKLCFTMKQALAQGPLWWGTVSVPKLSTDWSSGCFLSHSQSLYKTIKPNGFETHSDFSASKASIIHRGRQSDPGMNSHYREGLLKDHRSPPLSAEAIAVQWDIAPFPSREGHVVFPSVGPSSLKMKMVEKCSLSQICHKWQLLPRRHP